ncbi:MAG: Rad52/Rad22 family DNA repair protein [Candidatus Cloacimonadales bacterium]
MINQEIEQRLKEPFAQSDVEFRIARVLKNNQKAVVLAYITSRAVMDRLDQTFGINGWTDNYKVLENGIVCSLSVRINDEWISKEDTAPFTNIEALKGGFADALKRAAVKLGIGRYLYNLPEYYVDLVKDRPYQVDDSKIHKYFSREVSGWWVEPNLPSWAMQGQQPKEEKQNTQRVEKPHINYDNSSNGYNDDEIPETKEVNNSYLSPENLPNDRGQLQVLLNDYVKALIERNALTDRKKQEYLAKINERDASVGLLKYFYKQFTLIEKLFSLIQNGNVSEEERVDIYRSIMKANTSKLLTIEQDLNQKAA